MRAIVLFFLISGMLSACGGSDVSDVSDRKDQSSPNTKLNIVSTIKPVQAIVMAIAGEYAQSEQLIPDYASPHDYSFKPSDIRKVKNSDVIFRIDEHMESQMKVVLGNLQKNTVLISLADAEGIKLLENEASQHIHNDASNSKHDDHKNLDFHIWTSPRNAIVIANSVTNTLSKLDSKNTKNYQTNFENFSRALESESEKIATQLGKYSRSNYIVFHNSWQYFAKEFGLQKPVVVNLHEGVTSGAKTLKDIRHKIQHENIRCVFYDSAVSAAHLLLFSENEKIKTSEIDVLAEGIELNQKTYIQWLTLMTKKIEDCLSL